MRKLRLQRQICTKDKRWEISGAWSSKLCCQTLVASALKINVKINLTVGKAFRKLKVREKYSTQNRKISNYSESSTKSYIQSDFSPHGEELQSLQTFFFFFSENVNFQYLWFSGRPSGSQTTATVLFYELKKIGFAHIEISNSPLTHCMTLTVT